MKMATFIQKTSFVNGEIEYKRFNKDGLDISNGEEIGTQPGSVLSPDSPYSYKGKFKKGNFHGVWTSGHGSIQTYENGVRNGPSKIFSAITVFTMKVIILMGTKKVNG